MRLFSNLVAWILVISIFTSCSTRDMPPKTKEIAPNIELPAGWLKVSDDTYEINSPEGDLKIYFFKFEITDEYDFSKKSLELWKSIIPSFNYEESDKASPPVSEGWDKVSQIVYKVPAEDSKIVLSIAKEKDGIVYLNLVTSSLATISKRGPQLSTIIDSWKPTTIQKEDYSKVKAKKFTPTVEKELESFLISSKESLNLPGLAIGIVQDGKVVYNKGFGKTKVKNGEDINSETLFMIGSTTKSLTTLLISKLISDGKLSWDDKINHHLKGWELSGPKDTENMLMKHSACACTGMPRRDLDFIFEIDGISPEQRMLQMKKMGPTTKPGETFQYSNYLVAAGGFAAARAYNQNLSLDEAYRKAMKELVFKPLEMNRTKVTNTSPYLTNSAFPHTHNLDQDPVLIPSKIEEFVNSIAPAGSVWSSVDDMLKYISYELSEGEALPSYIDKKDLLLRRKKGVKITNNLSYGLGLMVEDNKGIEILHHGGNTMGFTSDMFFIPSENIGVVILVNQGSANTFRSLVKSKILELFFGIENKINERIKYYKTESKKGIDKLKSEINSNIKNKSKLIGNYRSEDLGQMKIYEKKNNLYADFGEFKSVVKEKLGTGSNRVFLLMSPPWNGSMELIYNKDNFTIDGGQKKYIFKNLK